MLVVIQGQGGLTEVQDSFLPRWMVPVELDVFGGKRTNQSRFPFGTYIFLNKISPWLLAGCFPTKIITPRHQFATC